MRKFIIDTDTASDDVIAIIAALKEKTVDVLALTVVAGNVSLDQATQNALTAIEVADTYQPLVYKGADKPLYRPLYKAENVHGDDGMGNMHLPASKLKVEDMHAVDALIELIEKHPHEIELITLGPLTNVALTCMKAPDVMAKLKSIILMAGTGVGPGNVTPYAEFNVYVDAQSLDIVLKLDVPKLFVGWDAITQGAFITDDEVSYLKNSESN
ncbi:MAG: nucleoside hydrolase, partial [Turicibacter sp.]